MMKSVPALAPYVIINYVTSNYVRRLRGPLLRFVIDKIIVILSRVHRPKSPAYYQFEGQADNFYAGSHFNHPSHVESQ